MAKVLPFQSSCKSNSTLRSDQVEALLGREFIWEVHLDRGYYTAKRVQVIGYDPERGIRLSCRGFEPGWCSVEKFQELQEEGVLISN